MDEKPAKVWAIFIIVLAVGLYYVLYEGLYNMIALGGSGGLGISIAIGPMVLGVLTLLVAFMVYGGNGKTFLTILLVLAILGNLISLMVLAAMQSFIEDFLGLDIEEVLGSSLTVGYITTALLLVLAIVTFILLQGREVKAYFKA